MKKIINNELVDLTTEEITQKQTDEAQAVTDKQAYETAETAKATAKASGNTKLLGLGLSQAEATAMTGYTPE